MDGSLTKSSSLEFNKERPGRAGTRTYANIYQNFGNALKFGDLWQSLTQFRSNPAISLVNATEILPKFNQCMIIIRPKSANQLRAPSTNVQINQPFIIL